MITVYDREGLTWIDLENPTKENAAELERRYDIHPVVLNELIEPSLRTKVDL